MYKVMYIVCLHACMHTVVLQQPVVRLLPITDENLFAGLIAAIDANLELVREIVVGDICLGCGPMVEHIHHGAEHVTLQLT